MPTRDRVPARRRVLGRGAALTVATFFGVHARAIASMDDVDAIIQAFTGDAEPRDIRLSLTTPLIAENGYSVPVGVQVDHPMTAADHVRAIMIIAPANPNPEVVTFRFTPASGRARIATRIRLARTQDVIALARLSDGSVLRTVNAVEVTIGGCGRDMPSPTDRSATLPDRRP